MKKIPRELSEVPRIKGEAIGRLGDGESGAVLGFLVGDGGHVQCGYWALKPGLRN